MKFWYETLSSVQINPSFFPLSMKYNFRKKKNSLKYVGQFQCFHLKSRKYKTFRKMIPIYGKKLVPLKPISFWYQFKLTLSSLIYVN